MVPSASPDSHGALLALTPCHHLAYSCGRFEHFAKEDSDPEKELSKAEGEARTYPAMDSRSRASLMSPFYLSQTIRKSLI